MIKKKFPQIPTRLAAKQVALKKELDNFVKKNFLGKTVVWQHGKYKGRRAKIERASWDFSWLVNDSLDIDVIVRTERADGKGYLEAYDNWHRTYRDVYSFEGEF